MKYDGSSHWKSSSSFPSHDHDSKPSSSLGSHAWQTSDMSETYAGRGLVLAIRVQFGYSITEGCRYTPGVVLNTTHLKCAQILCTSEQLHKGLLAYVYNWPCQFSPSRLMTASAVVDQVCFYP